MVQISNSRKLTKNGPKTKNSVKIKVFFQFCDVKNLLIFLIKLQNYSYLHPKTKISQLFPQQKQQKISQKKKWLKCDNFIWKKQILIFLEKKREFASG
jgi:hypothetical protein